MFSEIYFRKICSNLFFEKIIIFTKIQNINFGKCIIEKFVAHLTFVKTFNHFLYFIIIFFIVKFKAQSTQELNDRIRM